MTGIRPLLYRPCAPAQVRRLVCTGHRSACCGRERHDHCQHAGAGLEAPAAAGQPCALSEMRGRKVLVQLSVNYRLRVKSRTKNLRKACLHFDWSHVCMVILFSKQLHRTLYGVYTVHV